MDNLFDDSNWVFEEEYIIPQEWGAYISNNILYIEPLKRGKFYLIYTKSIMEIIKKYVSNVDKIDNITEDILFIGLKKWAKCKIYEKNYPYADKIVDINSESNSIKFKNLILLLNINSYKKFKFSNWGHRYYFNKIILPFVKHTFNGISIRYNFFNLEIIKDKIISSYIEQIENERKKIIKYNKIVIKY